MFAHLRNSKEDAMGVAEMDRLSIEEVYRDALEGFRTNLLLYPLE